MTRVWLSAAMAATIGASLGGQRAPEQPPTFRTATSLVTVDAVVVDGEGRHVTDLTREDFEVFEGGKSQQLRQVVYVPLTPAGLTSAPMPPVAEPGPESASGPVPPPASAKRLGPDPSLARARDSARLIAVVVDDLGLSFESTAAVRRALSRFVDDQVQPRDMVAILRTGAGVGALQQFTDDKRLLHAAVDRVRWSIISRAGISSFAPVVPPGATGASGNGGSGTAGTPEGRDDRTIEGLRNSMLATGSLGALEYVVRGVERLPGRKSVVFVSEGFSLIDRQSREWSAFTRVMDRANRAGVVVYTMDARGLATARLNAEDNPQPAAPRAGPSGPGSVSLAAAAQASVLEPMAARDNYLRDSQEALVYMAEQTGGFAILNTNDLNRGFGRVLSDLQGYYLLGFESSAPFQRSWDGGRIRIRVKRPGLRVRARQGFFGPAQPERSTETAPGDPLVVAALSPFSTGALDVRLTALFGHDAKSGSYVRALFFIDPTGVSFEDLPDGRHGARLTFLLITVGDNGQIVSQFRRELDLMLSEDEYRAAKQRGILYNARIPMKTPGGFQVRAAVRDERSSVIGSGSQFFEIPEVGKKKVALSGVVMQGTSAVKEAGVAVDSAEPSLAPATIEDAVFSEPGIRIFRPGSDAVYTCEIYDGVADAESNLSTFATLLRDGRTVYQTHESPVRARQKSNALRVVPVAGRLSLGRNMPRGAYTLRVTVSQARGGKVQRQASQWVDFEVR